MIIKTHDSFLKNRLRMIRHVLAKITLSGFRILRKTIFSVNGRNLSDQKLSGNFYGVSKRGSSMRSLLGYTAVKLIFNQMLLWLQIFYSCPDWAQSVSPLPLAGG